MPSATIVYYPPRDDVDADGVSDSSILTIDETNSRVGINKTSPSAELHVADGTAACITIVEATTDGAATYAESQLKVGSLVPLTTVGLGASWTPSGGYKASCGVVQGGLSGGLSLVASHASGDVRIYAGGSADGDLCATFADDQSLTLTGRFMSTGKGAAPTDVHYLGDVLNSATGWLNQLEIGNSSGSSGIRIGQGGSNNLGFGWSYNATASSAIGILNTYGYNNPIHIDAATIQIQGNSGGNTAIGSAALATTATAGFLWVTSSAGPPTGAATAPYSNAAALHYDSTNNKIYVRCGGTWRSTAALT